MLFVLIANFLSISLMSLPFCVPVTPRPLPVCFPSQCHYGPFFTGRGSKETLRMRVSSPWRLLPVGRYLKHLNLWRTDSVAHNTEPKFEGCAFFFHLPYLHKCSQELEQNSENTTCIRGKSIFSNFPPCMTVNRELSQLPGTPWDSTAEVHSRDKQR